MIEKKTVLDQIEITRDGRVQFRIGLLLVEDGQEISCTWHRSVVNPGDDVDAQVGAVNRHLKQMGKESLSADDLAKLKTHSKAAWTPDVIAAHKTRMRAAEKALSPAA